MIGDTLMEIALDTDQVQLLVAVDQKRVHMDPATGRRTSSATRARPSP
ncbi:hypothetical protein ACQEUV_33155 [Micromonospora aurantiaca (nom. illeg.)]